MRLPNIYLWQKAPALRLLLPFIAGIILQWHAQPTALFTGILIAVSAFLLAVLSLLPLKVRFKTAPLQGLFTTILLLAVAMLLVQGKDVRNNQSWFGKHERTKALVVTLQEPPVEKPNLYKAVVLVDKVVCNDSLFAATGKLILYFKKDAVNGLLYGSQLCIFKNAAAIKNSGNPGGFDYKRYSLFQGITHQAYLTANDFIILPAGNKSWLNEIIFSWRQRIVTILKTHISGGRESGLAEALLIGYKDDLDKTLVQSYSNTGVVHIIAISGLHVGLIYTLLLGLTKPLRIKKLRGLRFIIIVAALWAFGFLAGAQPSVMRSVVMFSFLAAGTLVSRNTFVYNNLALSALVLLTWNPFWLWDVGFQLSYIAVLSIIIFFKPVYNWIYLQNKLLDAVWKLMAVTIAAQALTTPVSLYYFHQFPLLFLFSNLVAVPLSSFILMGELFICVFSFAAPVAHFFGLITTGALRLMNGFVERMEALPFSAWPGLSVSAVQVLLLLLFIAGISYWLFEKKRTGLWIGLSSLLLFTTLRTFSFIHAARQQQLIVYNIARHQAIDVYSGRNAWFIGDAALMKNDPAVKLHLQPNRTLHRISNLIPMQTKTFTFSDKTIVILDTTVALQTFSKAHVDVLILSRNPALYLKDVAAQLAVSQIVLDASVPAWKAARWQHDCDSLHIPCYNVAEKGAFVMPVPRPTFAAP